MLLLSKTAMCVVKLGCGDGQLMANSVSLLEVNEPCAYDLWILWNANYPETKTI